MSNVLLCCGTLAKTPYYVKESCMNLYSVEELCYFVYHNAYILDDTFVSEKLVSWLQDEVELSQVAGKVASVKGKKGALGNLVRILNNEIGYYTEEQWLALLEDIDSNSRMPLHLRRKIRADGLLGGGRYAQALEEYEGIIFENKSDDPAFTAKIYHNLGVCAANLFLFERAAEYFKKAYETYANTESYVEMLCAMKMYMHPTQYLSFLADNKESYEDSLEIERKFEILKLTWGEQPAYKYFRELEKQKAEGGSYYESVDRLADEVKDIYRGYINGTW